MNLSMMRGDAKFIRLALTDVDGYPVILEDLDAITFTARKAYDDDSGMIVKTLADGGIVIVDSDLGVLEVAIESADTSGFARSYRLLWDIQAELYDLVQTFARGYLTVERDVTA